MSLLIKLLSALVQAVEDAMVLEEQKVAVAVLPSITEYQKAHTSHRLKKEHKLQPLKAINPPTLLHLSMLPLSLSNSKTLRLL